MYSLKLQKWNESESEKWYIKSDINIRHVLCILWNDTNSHWYKMIYNLISINAMCYVLAEIKSVTKSDINSCDVLCSRPNWFLCCKTALRIFHPVNPKNHLWSNPLSISIFRDKWHGKCTYMLNISKEEQIESDEVAYPQKSYLVWLPSALPHTFSELPYHL